MDDLERTRRIVISRLESLQQAGVMQLPRRKSTGNKRAVAVVPPVEPAGEKPVQMMDTRTPEMSKAISVDDSSQKARRSSIRTALFREEEQMSPVNVPAGLTLEVLRQQVAGCTRCSELARTRTQTVFGVGDPNARLCFLGEAPGGDEDRLGEPFVGRAGQLLTKIIEACKMTRDDVYILNMIKCRPPGNRNPLPTELANCREYLERQFDLIRPEFICCLGAVAAQNLLNTTVSIGKLRGKLHRYRDANVVCTYHPAFLLRSPSFKKETWEDMKFLMREMGTPVD